MNPQPKEKGTLTSHEASPAYAEIGATHPGERLSIIETPDNNTNPDNEMRNVNQTSNGSPQQACLPDPKPRNEDGVAVTTPSASGDPSGDPEQPAPQQSTAKPPGCHTMKQTTTPASDEDPNSDPDTAAAESSESQDKTADELMEEHVGEVPKAEKKFSLASLKSKSEEAVPKSNTKPGTITVGKPNDDTFVRTSAKPEEWAAFDFIELKSDNKKLYLLTPDVVEEINALNEDRAQVMIKTMKKRLIYSVTRLGDPFLWPITIMDDNSWIDSANTCAEAAKENWVRTISNQPADRYDYVTGTSAIEPKWPSMTYEEAVLKAFDGKVIDSMGHDLIKQLLGED
jgi:hypothetical protein